MNDAVRILTGLRAAMTARSFMNGLGTTPSPAFSEALPAPRSPLLLKRKHSPSPPARLQQPLRPRPLDYHGKLILAPMVRVGELPMRLTALYYGADIVYTPETIDFKLVGCTREVDAQTGCVRYVVKGRKESRGGESSSPTALILHPVERERVVLQLGTSDRERAIQAAMTVIQHGDVAGVDVNCGCPKHFSIQGGMGASLLTEPDRLCSILEGLVENVPRDVRVSCKIRMLESEEETIKLVKRIAKTGISALAVHCRTRDMRSSEPAMIHRLGAIVEAVGDESKGAVPVIANGDCWSSEEVDRIKKMTGVSSIMIARGAQMNASCFGQKLLPLEDEVIPTFLAFCLMTENRFQNSKYILTQMYKDRLSSDPVRKTKKSQSVLPLKTMHDIAALYELSLESLMDKGRRLMDQLAHDGSRL